MESSNFHNCDCEYCEYVDLQKSMTSLPINSLNTINLHRVGNGTTKHDSTVTSLPPKKSLRFEASPMYEQWSGLLIGLRLLGSFPISHKRGNEHRRSRVVFKWISWASFYTFALDAFRIAVCIWYYKDWGYFLLGRKYENTLLDWILKIMNYTIPLNVIWDVLMIWMTSKRGVILCNAWIDFNFLFADTFSEEYTKSSRIRKWHWIKAILMGIMLLGVSAGILGEIFGDRFVWFSAQDIRRPRAQISRLLRIPPAIFFLVILISEDVRVLFMYFTPAESFRRIRLAIQEQLKDFQNVTIPGNVVSSWTKILIAVRYRVKLTGHLQAPFLIPLFLHTTTAFTGLVFFGIQSLLSGRGSNHLVIVAVFGGSFMGRLILKTIMAENILSEEEAVVDLLLSTDSERFDMNGKLEVSKIVETLQLKPSKICLSGFITIEKKLITKIMGQIVAYLVVLIQFDLGYYGKKETSDCSNATVSS